MRSLYVPLVLRLEVADKSPLVSFNECSGIKSPTAGEKTRRRLLSSSMKKRSATASGGHAVSLPPDEDLSPAFESHKGSAHRPGRTAHNFPGRRAYSEVVVESLEAENIPFPISEPSSSTTSTILRSHKSTPETANLEHASYYYGNPLLEKTEGIMHFYKYNDEKVAETAQCRMLCMFAVPAQVTVREIVNFIALSTIESIKVVRDATPNQYMLIIKFKDHNDAVLFYEEFNNVNFNELESHRCFLLFVDRIECMSSDEMEICAASSSLAELPTCSVCLERLDDSVLAILCNHTFHASCLEKWADNTCPVCRYIQSPEVVAEQRCSECGQSNDLWICLICGNIGCGRYASQHAQRHWEMTSHTYSLKVGGERVWNYAGDNYVHRLIESDSDGKIVEYDRQGGSDADDKDDKLEGIKLEYTLLLTNQLEDQRKYFEERLADVEKAMSKMEKMAFAQVETLESQLFEQTADIKKLRQQLKDVEAIKITAEKKQAQTSEKLNKTKNELKDEQELNKMLRQDQQVWKNQWEKMKESFDAQRKTYDQQVEDLQAQINDLLMHFDAQTKFAQQVETGNVTQSDVVNGQLGISAAEPAKNTHRRKNNRK